MGHQRKLALVGALAVSALVLSGCVKNASTSDTPTGTQESVSQDSDLASLVPDSLKESGTLRVASDLTYAPNEYKDADGNAIGWEVDLINAVAAKLGLKTDIQNAKFDNIIPGITGDKYDIGLSSFFDTQEREQVVDMVNYYTAGIQWAAQKGKTVDPDNACGLTIAAQNQTTEILEDLPAKTKACTDAGKEAINVLGYDTQDDATNAVLLGRADAFTADAPVTNYAIKQMDGKLVQAGPEYDKFLYGLPIAKTAGTLKDAVSQALTALQKDGTYQSILSKWGVEAGAIDSITINGAGK